MQLGASSLVNVSIHSIWQRGREGATGRKKERRGKHRKNKGHGKYSKAHAWVLTKCKWKRKSPHQHIAIKGSSQDTCFSKTVFFSLSPSLLLLSCFCLSFPLSAVLLHPPPFLHPSIHAFCVFSVAGSTDHLYEYDCLSTTRGKQCVTARALKYRELVVLVWVCFLSPLLSGSSLFSRMSFASVPSSIRSSLVITPMVLIPANNKGTQWLLRTEQ